MTRTFDITLADLQEQHVALVRGHITMDQIAGFLGGAFGEVAAGAAAQGLTITGAPFGRYRFTDDGSFAVEAGFPVSGVVAAAGRVEPGILPGGTVARTLHVGSYDGVAAAYEATEAYLTDNGYEPAGAPWECYLDDPEVPNPRTEVFMPCRPVRPTAD
jgi:effector-binding domain-containing protein